MVASETGSVQATVLRDGSAVEVRPVGPDDGPRLLAFLSSLSVDSRYSRFFSLSPDLVHAARSAVGLTGERCFGLLALAPGGGPVVGHAGYWLLQPGRAEMAIAVADLYQGRGLGSLLLGRLARTGHEKGIEMFVMDVLPMNLGAVRLLSQSGHPLSARFRGDVIRFELVIGG